MNHKKKTDIHISKSKYMNGRQCPKRLWLELHEKQEASETDIELQFIYDEGTAVGQFAMEWRGKGTFIELDFLNIEKSYEDTKQAVAKGDKRLYEAAFKKGPYRAFVDIIEKLKDGSWRAIEVKSTTKPKDVHIPDLAFQVWLMQENGLEVSEAGVVHLNGSGVWPDKKSILQYSDMSEEIFAELKPTKKLAKELIKVAQAPTAPDIKPGVHCNDPYECDFKDYCGYQEQVVTYDGLPRLMPKQKENLEANGWTTTKAIPLKNDVLNNNQNIWLKVIKTNKAFIDSEFIRNWLTQLKYPVYSFDFETIAYRLPRFHGSSPFQQIPFQFSCHKMDKSGNITESGAYLHPDTNDPRPELIIAMINALGKKGSIVAWNASFERSIINQLINHFPQYKVPLDAINERLLDPIEIFRKAYFHPKAMGSASIKDVGKALLSSDADYTNMEVSHGGLAFATWHYWIQGKGNEATEKALRDYCHKDTLIPLQLLSELKKI